MSVIGAGIFFFFFEGLKSQNSEQREQLNCGGPGWINALPQALKTLRRTEKFTLEYTHWRLTVSGPTDGHKEKMVKSLMCLAAHGSKPKESWLYSRGHAQQPKGSQNQRVAEMAQLERRATNGDTVRWLPETRVVGERGLLQVVLWPPHAYFGTCMHIYIHMHM